MHLWSAQEAKARFSRLMEDAQTGGPQVITRHGRERVVVLAVDDYRALLAQRPDFKAHLLGGPKVDAFHVSRSADRGREVKL